MAWLLSLLTGGVVEKFTGPLERAWTARLTAQTDAKRLEADQAIRSLETQRDIALAEAGDRWSAVRLGRWLIVVPFGLWWAAIYLVQIINPWLGLNLVVIDVPQKIHDMALILIPAIVIGDAGALLTRRFRG
jgi:hypothetical protein